MNALLIDDEPAANTTLKNMLRSAHPQINVVGEATNIRGALLKTRQLNPDILFLDIEMPGGTGFDLIRQLDEATRPEIVFVTSHNEFALQAFNAAVLDYVLKPVEHDALKTAVSRAKERLHHKNSARRLEALLANMDSTSNMEKQIGIPSNSGVEFVKAGDIVCCRGFEGYTVIHLEDRSNRISSYPIGRYKKMLPTPDFFMTHRSFVVNKRYVKKITTDELVLNGGLTAEISRRRKKLVEQWLY